MANGTPLADVFEEEQRLRGDIVTAAGERTAAARALVPALQEQGRIGQAGLRRQAAQALGASLGQFGGTPVGGGVASALRGTALERGIQSAQFGADQATREAQARQEAAVAAQEGALQEQAIASAQAERGQTEFLSALETMRNMQRAGNSPPVIAAQLEFMRDSAIDPEARERINGLIAFINPPGFVIRQRGNIMAPGNLTLEPKQT